MRTRKISSREFNQDTSGAKRAAQRGPVIITERGKPSHVLLTFREYERLSGPKTSIGDLLSHPDGVADVELDIPPRRDRAKGADLD